MADRENTFLRSLNINEGTERTSNSVQDTTARVRNR